MGGTGREKDRKDVNTALKYEILKRNLCVCMTNEEMYLSFKGIKR